LVKRFFPGDGFFFLRLVLSGSGFPNMSCRGKKREVRGERESSRQLWWEGEE
jgi:hypothetical protein